jgi:hypothetical protein
MANKNPLKSLGFTKSISERLIIVAYALVYSGLLFFLYKFELSVYWGYMGFSWEPNSIKLLLVLFIIGSTAFFLPTSTSTRSVFLQLCVYFHFIPSLMIYALQDRDLVYLAALLTGTFF